MIPKTMRLISWDGPIPEPGEFLRSQGGSLYLVLSYRLNARPDPKSVAAYQLGKLEPDDPRPRACHVVHDFAWGSRS